MLVDNLGLLLAVIVTPANVTDIDGAVDLLAGSFMDWGAPGSHLGRLHLPWPVCGVGQSSAAQGPAARGVQLWTTGPKGLPGPAQALDCGADLWLVYEAPPSGAGL